NNGNYIPILGDFTNPGAVQVGAAGSPLWDAKFANFAPRVGAAYQLRKQPGWETVIRSGFGLFFDLGTGLGAIAPWTVGYPGLLSNSFTTGVVFPIADAQAVLPVINLSNPPAAQRFYVFPAGHQLPRTFEWNFAIQQSLGRAQSLTVTYAGASG